MNPSDAPSGAVCAASRDGGATFGELVATGLDDCFGLTGQIRAGPEGRLYLAQVDCDDGTGKVTVAVSEDEGASWRRHVLHEGLGVPDLGDGIGTLLSHEADVEVDATGNVYVLWLDGEARAHLATSMDHGASWSSPMDVTRPGLEVSRFPSLVAGDAGRVAFQYIGRPGPEGPDTPWNAYVGFILDARAEAPIIATTTANPLEDPIHRGECNDRCQATMSNPPSPMGDFLDMDIDPTTGAVWTALVDLCPENDCHSQSEIPTRLQEGAAVGVQAGGSTLREGGTL